MGKLLRVLVLVTIIALVLALPAMAAPADVEAPEAPGLVYG